MDDPVIKVAGLSRRFGEIIAVDGIDFEVRAGAIAALLGGNGAGKTTTIAMLLGLLLPSEGKITVLGEDMLRRRNQVLPRINFSSPYVDMPRRLTVRENLSVYARLYGVRDIAATLSKLTEELRLGDFLKRETGTLSAGQRTRVALGKALLNDPELLLLDEPTASLDPDSADWIRGYLERYRQRTGAAILLASHNMGEVERLCDDVMVMRTGRIIDRGTPNDLILKHGRSNMEEVFLHLARQTGAEAA